MLGKIGKQNQSDEMNKLQAVTVIVFVVCGFFWLDVTSDWFRHIPKIIFSARGFLSTENILKFYA